MTRTAEPVIVVIGGTGRESLADVLITLAERQSAPALCAELHMRYPGLSVALVVCEDGFLARFLDGTQIGVVGTPEEAAAIARRLYRRWLISRRGSGGGSSPARRPARG